MDDYEKLLDKAKEELPETVKQRERFEIPKVRGHVEGNKTIISNFKRIADKLGRKPGHLLKYVLREIASPGEIVENRIIIGTKVSASRINELMKSYAEDFVYCKECGAPDSKIEKENNNVYILTCQACGARYSIYGKI